MKFVFFLLPRLGYSFFPRENLLSPMICNWYSYVSFLNFIFQLLTDNNCANHAIYVNNQDQVLRNNLIDHPENNCLDEIILDWPNQVIQLGEVASWSVLINY